MLTETDLINTKSFPVWTVTYKRQMTILKPQLPTFFNEQGIVYCSYIDIEDYWSDRKLCKLASCQLCTQ
jgi:hypothetical protein